MELSRLLSTNSALAEKSAALGDDHITRHENKAGDYVQNVAADFPQQMDTTEEHKQDIAEEPQQLSVDDSNGGLSFDQNRELVAVGPEEAAVQLLLFNNTEETFSVHIIPVEEEDDDDVQFVQETQQEPAKNTSAALNNDNQLPLDINSAENVTTNDDAGVLCVETTKTNADKFPCKICFRTFFHMGTLTRHMKSHKSNFCNICKQHFPQQMKLDSHSCVLPPSLKQAASVAKCAGRRLTTRQISGFIM